MRKTVFGNVGSLLSFRVGGDDANILAAEFNPRFINRDLINLGVQDFCLKMSINGEIKEAFSGRTLPVAYPKDDYTKECIDHSRKEYARPVSEVHEILKQWEEGKLDNPTQAQTTAASNFDNDEEFEEPII
jgi:hypothetical protein